MTSGPEPEAQESKPSRHWTFAIQYLISPALLLIIGWWLNLQVEEIKSKTEEAKQRLQVAELELHKIQAVQGMLEKLFTGTPEQAFITERLLTKIVEKDLADEISRIVAKYYEQELQLLTAKNEKEKISSSDVAAAEEISDSAKRIGSDASGQINKVLAENLVYVVVRAFNIHGEKSKAKAIEDASTLIAKGYDATVWESNNGFYRIAIGHLPIRKANELRKQAIAAGDVENDSYLSPGATLVTKVFPQ